jgi:tetratricopeptide (TPR) repeat protein
MLIAFLYAAGTIDRNNDYKTPHSFLQSTVTTMIPVPVSLREDPRFFEPVKNFYTAYKNLGIIYQQHNQPEQAIAAFTSALGYTTVYFSIQYAASVKVLLATSLVQTGRLEEASLLLKEARPFVENQAKVDDRLGMILQKFDDNKEAELYVQQVIMKDDGRNR